MTMRAAAFLLATILLAGSAQTAGAAKCQPDEKPDSAGGCIPRDAVDCGHDAYCYKGETCVPGGCYCPPNAACSHHEEATGPVCRVGGYPCLAGEACAPDGTCYDPGTQYFCGEALCRKGVKYPAGNACAACAASTGAPPTPAKRGACPNIVGSWTSWASLLFGRGDATFAADGTATHRSGFHGKWWCDNGELHIDWGDGRDSHVTVSPDGQKIFNATGRLSFSR